MFLVYHYYRRGVLLIYVCKRVFIKKQYYCSICKYPKGQPSALQRKKLSQGSRGKLCRRPAKCRSPLSRSFCGGPEGGSRVYRVQGLESRVQSLGSSLGFRVQGLGALKCRSLNDYQWQLEVYSGTLYHNYTKNLGPQVGSHLHLCITKSSPKCHLGLHLPSTGSQNMKKQVLVSVSSAGFLVSTVEPSASGWLSQNKRRTIELQTAPSKSLRDPPDRILCFRGWLQSRGYQSM